MNIHTNELTDSKMRDLLEQKYTKEMLDAGKDPKKGATFETYFNAFQTSNAEGKPFKNATQLQDAVGGRYIKAQIAFNILEEASSTVHHHHREVPAWFTKPIEAALQIDIASLWQCLEQDIATIVESRVKIAEHQAELKRQQVLQSSETIEELQDRLAELEPLPNKISVLTEENQNMCTEVKRLQNLVKELQVNADASFEYQRENAILDAERNRLSNDNELLRSELTRSNEALQQSLIEKATLEGRLVERKLKHTSNSEECAS